MNNWDKVEWTASARNLVDWAIRQDMNRPLMLLIRHSHRDVLRDHQDMLSGGLTTLGKQFSIEMGRRLPVARRAHIFFSIVPRCYQTAEAIAEGFSEQGGEIIDMDPLPTLVRPEYTESDVWKNLNPNGENVTDFVNRWAEGKFEGIESFDDFKVRLMDDTLKRLLSVDEPQLHIHVTHDLSLMSAKRTFFDRALTLEDRESYLGGIGVTIIGSTPTLYTSGKTMPIEQTLL
ncbi:MAG: phosphoglycerate mutase family protein [Candidatus Thorarchaeota archaeon]|nr:phosphoglycerate mutase family protein [Candidatus Thorarchaeota archaeon]